MRRIGQGSFAQVFEAELIPNNIKVAIKAFHETIIEKKKLNSLIDNEIKILKLLNS
jgi:serine/threonine protein kinase